MSHCTTLADNLATLRLVPAVAGLFFHEWFDSYTSGPHALAYYLVVFVTFVVALGVNFIIAVGYQSILDGASLAQKTRDVLVSRPAPPSCSRHY